MKVAPLAFTGTRLLSQIRLDVLGYTVGPGRGTSGARGCSVGESGGGTPGSTGAPRIGRPRAPGMARTRIRGTGRMTL